MNIPVLLKELAKISAIKLTEETVKTFVEVKIKPIFANWGKDDLRSVELEDCLSEYLLRCYAKNNIMTTIVFGKLQKTLDDLYIPLTFEEYRNKEKQWVIDENCYNILDNYSRILIVDMAGMGKSTIVKYFACQGVNLDKCIPIVIELRRLEKNQSILEYIQTQINSLDKNVRIEEIVDILEKGDFVIFFDGYDEIANENKADVLDAIQEFTSKAINTKIVITSREEDDLNSLGEYKCVNIKPLTEEEAYELIKKYDNDGDISKKLVKRLKDDSSMDVLKEFLENPLLVSLLYKTFEYKEEIPYKKIDFYEQVYAALFNDHDKTKGSAYVHEKRTKLDKYQFEQILRAFGFLCLKVDKVEYSDQLIHHMLSQAIGRFSWLKISVDDFLYDITHAIPFIQKDGNEYKWVHKSFMEYFASCFICYDNKENEQGYFEKMAFNDLNMKYYNVFDFCYEIDTLGFRKYIILPCLKKYVNKYDSISKHELPKLFDKNIINMARNLLSFDLDIHFCYYNMSIKEEKKAQEDKMQEFINMLRMKKDSCQSLFCKEVGNNVMMLCTSKTMSVQYRIIAEKMPELFDKWTTKEEKEYIDFKTNTECKFDDYINNLWDGDEGQFSQIINDLYEVIDYYNILNYNLCKKLINEIETESSINNNDVFAF